MGNKYAPKHMRCPECGRRLTKFDTKIWFCSYCDTELPDPHEDDDYHEDLALSFSDLPEASVHIEHIDNGVGVEIISGIDMDQLTDEDLF